MFNPAAIAKNVELFSQLNGNKVGAASRDARYQAFASLCQRNYLSLPQLSFFVIDRKRDLFKFFILKIFFMKSHSKLIAVKSLVVLLCATLFSFSSNRGGDSFEIVLNGKRVLQQFVYASKSVQTIQLVQSSDNDKLDIYYSHCGQVGKNRHVTIKNEKDQPIKVWKFEDTPDKDGAMSFKLRDILSLRKNKTEKLILFYSSSELPSGRTLAMIAGDETGIARK